MVWCQVVCTSLMPPDSMKRLVAEHADLDHPAEDGACRLAEQRRQHADADVQVLAVADDGREERSTIISSMAIGSGQDDGAVEHVAREHAPRDDQGDDDQADAGDDEAGAMQRIHRPDVLCLHLPLPSLAAQGAGASPAGIAPALAA